MYAPLVNNLTVFGCFLSFTLVFMNGLDDRFLSMTTLENFCYTRLWWYAIGFSFIMAPLVAKAVRFILFSHKAFHT